MSCLFRRSNGIWYVVYPERTGRKWLSTGERCYGRAYGIFRTCPSGSDRRRPMTISGFLGELQDCGSSSFSKGTAYLYKHSISNLIRIIGDKPIRFVSVKDVERYKTARSKVVSPVSVNVEFRTLKAAFNIAVRWEVITENVFTKSKKLPVPQREPVHLSKEEFQSLLVSVDDDELRNVFQFAVWTMMRRGEIVNLEWSDVDLERGLIHVRNKENFTVKAQQPRVVPMSNMVRNLLRKKERMGPFVFISANGHPLKPGHVSHRFKKYARHCRLAETVHFHSLRHTGATWLIQNGVPLYDVQKILGHSSPVMTQRYSHLSDHHLLRSIERMNDSVPATGVAVSLRYAQTN